MSEQVWFGSGFSWFSLCVYVAQSAAIISSHTAVTTATRGAAVFQPYSTVLCSSTSRDRPSIGGLSFGVVESRDRSRAAKREAKHLAMTLTDC